MLGTSCTFLAVKGFQRPAFGQATQVSQEKSGSRLKKDWVHCDGLRSKISPLQYYGNYYKDMACFRSC